MKRSEQWTRYTQLADKLKVAYAPTLLREAKFRDRLYRPLSRP